MYDIDDIINNESIDIWYIYNNYEHTEEDLLGLVVKIITNDLSLDSLKILKKIILPEINKND